MNNDSIDRRAAEVRFGDVFAHLGFIAAYARRRNSRDPEGLAAEAMTIAWRRLADIPLDDARPWLIATARNLLKAERRRETAAHSQQMDELEFEAPEQQFAHDLDIDPHLAVGLLALSDRDREALLLIAWEDLTPALAAASLGISPTAFRVRLHRARRRLSGHLTASTPVSNLSSPRPDWTHS